jgi:hypothetical protein
MTYSCKIWSCDIDPGPPPSAIDLRQTHRRVNCSKHERLTKAQERDTSHLSIASVHKEIEFDSGEVEQIKIENGLPSGAIK